MNRLALASLGTGIVIGLALAQLRPVPAHAAAPACPWGPELDAVRAAPANHRVLLENDRVRVLDVLVRPGEREPLHAHCNPSVLYVMERRALREYDGGGRIVRDDKAAPPSLPVIQWHATEPPHSVENPDTVPIHILRVELKS